MIKWEKIRRIETKYREWVGREGDARQNTRRDKGLHRIFLKRCDACVLGTNPPENKEVGY